MSQSDLVAFSAALEWFQHRFPTVQFSCPSVCQVSPATGSNSSSVDSFSLPCCQFCPVGLDLHQVVAVEAHLLVVLVQLRFRPHGRPPECFRIAHRQRQPWNKMWRVIWCSLKGFLMLWSRTSGSCTSMQLRQLEDRKLQPRGIRRRSFEWMFRPWILDRERLTIGDTTRTRPLSTFSALMSWGDMFCQASCLFWPRHTFPLRATTCFDWIETWSFLPRAILVLKYFGQFLAQDSHFLVVIYWLFFREDLVFSPLTLIVDR